MTESQPRYQALFSLLKKRQAIESLHHQALSSVAFKFRDALYQQLGFPEESYLKPAADNDTSNDTEATREPWVQLYEYADGNMQPATGPVLRTIKEDGSLTFAIGVSLSAELDSQPKYLFWAAYSLSITDSDETPVLSTISGKIREYQIINDDFSKIIDDFVRDISVALDPDNIFSAAKKSDCIGFFCNA